MENLLVILVVAVLLGLAWMMVRDMGREHVEPLGQGIPEYWGADIFQSQGDKCIPDEIVKCIPDEIEV